MKRRDAVKLIPLSYAGIIGLQTRSYGYAQPLGLQFLATIRTLLEKIKTTRSDELLEASHRIAEAVMNGKKCYVQWDMGHSTKYDIWPERPGLPNIFVLEYPQDVEKGDIILTDCYYDDIEEHRKKGAFIISGPRPWGGDCAKSELLVPEVQRMKLRPYADLWIDNYSDAYGAMVSVPGEIAPIGPDSGVVGMMTFWMIVSDAVRLLALNGKSFTVSGDEPPLAKDNVTVDMNRPLGEVYYDTAVNQQKAIEDDFDKINRIAFMATHSVLIGGRVYVYSRYYDNLAVEGTVRRGGLGLTFGVYGPPDKLILVDDPLQQGRIDLTFNPTDKDTIIMGIGKPDDSDDLASLDNFRKSGASISAIGPATRNWVVPQGRTVPKEVDVYCGNMCDAYGLFALPGIKRKVTPTSGLINNQIFWAVCCQIAEQIIQRTGNAPGIYLSGALRGGMEKLNEVKRLYKERGY